MFEKNTNIWLVFENESEWILKLQKNFLEKHADFHQIETFISAANKYYSSAGHHEQKNKKTTGQIKFSAVTIRQ